VRFDGSNRQLTPLGAAAVELHALRGWGLPEALRTLARRLRLDHSCPASALFPPGEVRRFYRERGREVNVVRLPQNGRFGSSSGADSAR
jgi:hypothetical protein